MSAAANAWTVVQQEVSGFGDVEEATRAAVRLVMAGLLGGALGYERQEHGSAAGLRTHMMVAVGSALFVVSGALSGMSPTDLSRIVQGLATGIGFLGAGAIMKLRAPHEVKGLTTAASVWVTAAIGVAAGLGQYGAALAGTIVGLVVLSVLRRLER